jgi:hypothetical protein
MRRSIDLKIVGIDGILIIGEQNGIVGTLKIMTTI